MMKFWYHLESDSYVTSENLPNELCTQVTPSQYCAIHHPNLYVYDIETYPNVFTVTIHRPSDNAVWRFEVSFRINQSVEFFTFLSQVKASDGRMVGFNNIHFDYPVIHELISRGGFITSQELYAKAQAIIDSFDGFGYRVWEQDWFIPQIDLFKIHHFDNKARSTGLKILEFNMGSDNIQDLPFEPGTLLTSEQIDDLIPYNDHDVFETSKFLYESLPLLEFRDELSAKYDRNFTNNSDTKIGKDYFIMQLEKSGIECFHRPNGKKEPKQTKRPVIDLNSVILPWIDFSHPEFKRIINWLRSQTLKETKGVFKDLHCRINGFQYDFGTGGIHGSIESQIVRSDEENIIIDLDVASYYPNLAIANNFFPEHLSQRFCEIYEDVYNQRKGFRKGTPENAMLKLALNGVYGDSNNKYSPFFDPAYTMAITINGQLLLCLLAEYLISGVTGLQMIQINTDGLTVRCPRHQSATVMWIAEAWEQLTGLTLERADYERMFIRDVNNYIAEYTDGKLKRKGAYCYGDDLDWHQNFSSQIVAIAAEKALVNNTPIEQTVTQHANILDFMRRTKVPRSSRLMLESELTATQLQNITRYYVSDDGGSLMKIMPPTPKQVEKDPDAPERRIGIDVGWKVTPCNDFREMTPFTPNYQYYIEQAEKLVSPLIG